jgi:dTDP-4-amino-4,6-dideoxygalactose transaminase
MDRVIGVPLLDLNAQTNSIRAEIDAALQGVVDSSAFVLGPETAKFEEEFAAYCGVRYAVGVSSGTSALHLALRAAGIGPGDEVITSTHTFIATVEAILMSGARPVLADILPDTYCVDPASAAERLTSRTRAILPVHIYGQTCNMGPLVELAREHGLVVIEDAAQAHGAYYGEKRAGSLGDVAAFSFYPSKNLGAFGDGGMVTTDDAEIRDRLVALRHHGQVGRDLHDVLGYADRLDALQAAVLRVKLPYLDRWNELRRERARWYAELLEGTEYGLPQVDPACDHVYHVFAVTHPARERAREALTAHGIGWSQHYRVPVHLQKSLAFLEHGPGDFPVAERLASQVTSLPMFPEMTREQVERVCTALREIPVAS